MKANQNVSLEKKAIMSATTIPTESLEAEGSVSIDVPGVDENGSISQDEGQGFGSLDSVENDDENLLPDAKSQRHDSDLPDLSPGALPSVPKRGSMFQRRKTEHTSFLEGKKRFSFTEKGDDPNTLTASRRGVSFRSSHSSRKSEDSMEDDDDDLEMEESLWKHDLTFDQLQEIYDHTIKGLDSSGSLGINLEPVKNQFVRLWDGIQKSHHNVVRLQKKDHDFSVRQTNILFKVTQVMIEDISESCFSKVDLAAVMAKTRTLIKLSEEDPIIASRLRAKLESAWGLADIGEVEQRKNAIKIYKLKEDVFLLNRSIEIAAKTEGRSTVVELTKLKAQVEGQKNVVASEEARLHSDLTMIFEKRQEFGEMQINLEEKLKLLMEEEIIYQEAINREKARKDRLQKAIKHTIIKSEQKTDEVEQLLENLSKSETRLSDVERYVREQQTVNEEVLNELEMSNNKYIKLKQDYETEVKLCKRLTTDLFKKQKELKERDDEVATARTMISRMNCQKQANLKKVVEYKSIVSELETERENLKGKLVLLEKDLEASQKKLAENKRKLEELDRDRTIMNKTLQRAIVVTSQHENQVFTHKLAVQNLETDIISYEKEMTKQEIVILELEKARDRFSHEAKKLAHQVVVRLEEVKKLDRTIYDYHKKLGRIETLLQKQNQVYDNAVYEKSIAHRQLRDAANEAMENSMKLSHLTHDIMSLKFQVGEKDTIIHIEASRYERVLRETSFYAGEGKRLKHLAYDIQRMVEALVAERLLLKKTVMAIESEMAKQLYYTTTAESRNEVFIRKLMSKEIDLKEIWEKWRVIHSKIRIGAYHFRLLMKDIRRIRVQIFEIKKENVVKSHGKNHAQKLQHEITVLETVISKEAFMCNSLRESMRHPINVHRWRVLECTYPEAYEMVIKTNLLTKRLVERNAVLSQQEKDLVYKQEIYCQIREAFARSAGLETPEDMTYHKHLVDAKRRQYKALQFDLKASKSQAEYYEEELGIIKNAFINLKTKYFQEMLKAGRTYSNDYMSDIDWEDDDQKLLSNSKTSLEGLANQLEIWKSNDNQEEDDDQCRNDNSNKKSNSTATIMNSTKQKFKW